MHLQAAPIFFSSVEHDVKNEDDDEALQRNAYTI